VNEREDDVDKQEQENGRPDSAGCETQVRHTHTGACSLKYATGSSYA